MGRLPNIHPGEILHEEFLVPFDVSAYRLSKDIGIPQTRIAAILKGRRRITANTALRLSIYFGTTPKFWLGLQNDFDLEEEKILQGTELKKLRPFNRTGMPTRRKKVVKSFKKSQRHRKSRAI